MAIYPDLDNKNIVITGANGDIGLALCEKFLEQNGHVYAIYHYHSDELEKLKEQYGEKLTIIQCDVADANAVTHLLTELESKITAIDVLINNAGICKDNLFSLMTDDEFDQVIKVNLYGTFFTTKKLLPLLRQAKSAAIVNVASIAGITATFGQTNYSASKAGIIGMTRTLAAEYATKGIRINAVAPGMIESKMVKKVSRQIVRGILAVVALRRLGRVDEIAEVVAFLSSESSSYIIGQTIIADGGLVMH